MKTGSKDNTCPFFDWKNQNCSLKEERKTIPYGGFGGCLTTKYPECDAYKVFKWKLVEKVVFT